MRSLSILHEESLGTWKHSQEPAGIRIHGPGTEGGLACIGVHLGSVISEMVLEDTNSAAPVGRGFSLQETKSQGPSTLCTSGSGCAKLPWHPASHVQSLLQEGGPQASMERDTHSMSIFIKNWVRVPGMTPLLLPYATSLHFPAIRA